MQLKRLWIAATVPMIGITVGCASETAPSKTQPGMLAPGTAQVAVNGGEPQISTSLRCSTNSYLTTLDIADEGYSVTAMVSNRAAATVALVRIDDVDGFSGGYNEQLGGNATVTMTEATYHISGDIYGIGADNPVRESGTFRIDAAC